MKKLVVGEQSSINEAVLVGLCLSCGSVVSGMRVMSFEGVDTGEVTFFA